MHECGYYELASMKSIFGGIGHSGAILSASLSNDGVVVATVSANGEFCVWSMKSQKQLARRTWDRLTFNALACIPHSGLAVLGGGEYGAGMAPTMLSVLKLPEATSEKSIKGSIQFQDCSGLACSPDASVVAVATRSESVMLFETKTMKLLQHLDNEYQVTSVTYSPDGKLLACGGWHRVPMLWETETRKQVVVRFPQDEAAELAAIKLLQVVFSVDGSSVLALTERNYELPAGKSNHLDVWNLGARKRTGTYTLGERQINAIAAIDAEVVACASDDGSIALFDVVAGRFYEKIMAHQAPLRSLCCSSDRSLLVCASDDTTCSVWSVQSLPRPVRRD
jgi:WD40 repeat protein